MGSDVQVTASKSAQPSAQLSTLGVRSSLFVPSKHSGAWYGAVPPTTADLRYALGFFRCAFGGVPAALLAALGLLGLSLGLALGLGLGLGLGVAPGLALGAGFGLVLASATAAVAPTPAEWGGLGCALCSALGLGLGLAFALGLGAFGCGRRRLGGPGSCSVFGLGSFFLGWVCFPPRWCRLRFGFGGSAAVRLCTASPKSPTLRCHCLRRLRRRRRRRSFPCDVRKMFSSLTSKWIMRWRCTCASASMTWWNAETTTSRCSGMPVAMWSRRLPPSQYSMTMQT
mmetsp:Transcript_26321/g.81977  ORF Transcript_26321/g.81977 Transcript_26321/m.81977 type:complete len:284 (-) Transcript_26321:551-1402(-)